MQLYVETILAYQTEARIARCAAPASLRDPAPAAVRRATCPDGWPLARHVAAATTRASRCRWRS